MNPTLLKTLVFLNTVFLYFNSSIGALQLISGMVLPALLSFGVAGLNYFALKTLENQR